MKLEATLLRGGMYAVRPEGQLGTAGFHPAPWQVIYVKAADELTAIMKAVELDAQSPRPWVPSVVLHEEVTPEVTDAL